MRVLIDYRPALRERSGSGEYTHQLVKALLASYPAAGRPRALELTLFSSSWKDRLTPSPDLAGAATVDRRVPVRLLNLAWHRLGWPPAETLAGGTYDVVHSPHPLPLPARAAAQVITIHDLEPRKNVGGLLDAYERLLQGPADAGHYVQGESGHNVRGESGDSARGDGGHNARSVPELVLAGRATDEAKPWLDRISRPPLCGAVRHIGYVDANDRRALYEGARLLVQPSFDEGFGMPVLEAMSLGVPVVAANRGSLAEVLGDAGLLVDPDQPADIAHAIARVLDEDALAAACAEKGIARARAFRWDETAHRVYDTDRQTIERRAQRPAVHSSPWCNSICIRTTMHPSWLRCFSLKYSRYSRSSRLASRAPRCSRCDDGVAQRATNPCASA